MKKACLLFLVLLVSISSIEASPQKKKKRATVKEPVETAKPTPAPSQVQVRIRYTNGTEVYGRLININMNQVLLDAGNGKIITSTLQEVASLAIGETPPKIDPQFISDASTALQALSALSIATTGITFSQYQPKVNEAKQAVESFIAKYEKTSQQDLFKALRNIVKGYESVSPIWSLRVGQEQHKYVYDYSEQMKTVFELYPDIRQVAWKQNERYPIEKVIAWIWQQNTQLVDQNKQKVAKLH
ncbi:MAG: hypothetical protein HY819_12845 [Acidobacteria bacterium]|nr:hypothetical protein [Acidobacteriota bacterium]